MFLYNSEKLLIGGIALKFKVVKRINTKILCKRDQPCTSWKRRF